MLRERGGLVWCGGWPQSLMCGVVKHRPASLAPGWVTLQVFSDESSPPHTHVLLIPDRITPYKMLVTIAQTVLNYIIRNNLYFSLRYLVFILQTIIWRVLVTCTILVGLDACTLTYSWLLPMLLFDGCRVS